MVVRIIIKDGYLAVFIAPELAETVKHLCMEATYTSKINKIIQTQSIDELKQLES